MSQTTVASVRVIGSEAMDVLMDAVERLAQAADELAVANVLRTATRRLTGADGISIVLKRGDRVHYVDEDAVGPLWKGQDFPQEACISGWAIMNKQTVVIEDIKGDPRIPLAAYEPTFVKSLAMAPVGLPNPIASIGAYWGTQRRPTDDEVQALETMARAASVALQNVRLRRELEDALAEAKAAERAKSTFLGNMSREIRRPMSSIASLVEVLENGVADPRHKQVCALLKSSAEDAVELVSAILDFAQLEAGRANLFRVAFDLEAAVRTAAAPHALKASERGLNFAIEIADDAKGLFMGDAMRVQQVVDALASNAVRFTDRGGVVVRLEEEERVGIRSMFKLSVVDTGLGYDETAVDALFDRFSQGPSARGGLGLGLAVAGAITRAMGGEISARAGNESGSVFSVRIPLERQLEDAKRHIDAKSHVAA